MKYVVTCPAPTPPPPKVVSFTVSQREAKIIAAFLGKVSDASFAETAGLTLVETRSDQALSESIPYQLYKGFLEASQ